MDFESVLSLFTADPRILALYVLGSAASDTMRPDSDVDMAILLEPGKKMGALERAELAADATLKLSRDVDLGELCSRNLIYAREAILKGRRLFTRNESRADLIETGLLGMYAQFNEDRREVLDAYRI